MSDTGALSDRARVALNQADRTLDVLRASGLTLFVKGIDNKTYTLEHVWPGLSIRSLEQRLQEKRGGGPPARLSTGAKSLDPERTVGDYDLQANTTLFELGRLLGGYHERDAIASAMHMGRGNVRKVIDQSRGESRVLLRFVRQTRWAPDYNWERDKAVQAACVKAGIDPRLLQSKEMRMQIDAVVQETAGAANCGEYSASVCAALIGMPPPAEGTAQYVFRLSMKADPDRKEPFDHALCCTYPDQLPHGGPFKLLSDVVSTPEEIDKVTIADGWDNNMIIPLKKFLSGGNAYEEKILPRNLKIVGGPFRCTGQTLPEPVREAVASVVQRRLDEYKADEGYADLLTEALADDELIFHIDIEDRVHDLRTLGDHRKKLRGVLGTTTALGELLDLAAERPSMVLWAFREDERFAALIRGHQDLKNVLYLHMAKLRVRDLHKLLEDRFDAKEFLDFTTAEDETYERVLNSKILRRRYFEAMLGWTPEDISQESEYMPDEVWGAFEDYADENGQDVSDLDTNPARTT